MRPGTTRLELDGQAIREALKSLPVIAAQETLEPPPLAHVFVPASHHKALSLDSTVVVGMRGAGKSLWTAVLQQRTHRKFVADLVANSALAKAEVRVGFGLDESNQHFPSSESIGSLVDGLDPLVIWKTVVLRHASAIARVATPIERESWVAACRWVDSNRGVSDTLLTECDQVLADRGEVLLVLFDALDRLATDWTRARNLISGALQFALACRSRKALRLKFFLRPDMEEDPELWRFPDSSKLRHARVELAWKPPELYALLLTHLANDVPCNPAFRTAIAKALGVDWKRKDGTFLVPGSLSIDGQELKATVEAIAGEWMGMSKKRGLTYTWVPSHLADAKGRASPRSFLLAFRGAAIATAEQHPEHAFALHYEGINQGVVEASKIRIEEIKEDYPWVEPLLEAARGLSVPCEPRELESRWTGEQLRRMRSATVKLPPRRFTTDPFRSGEPTALIEDLIELAVLYRAEKGRLNMPDIFRVGFGIKRKGGVKPLRP